MIKQSDSKFDIGDISKTTLGIPDVENYSAANMPISDAQATVNAGKADLADVITRNNTEEWSPGSAYEPATKAYVDAMATSGGGNVAITTVERFVAGDGNDGVTFTTTSGYILGSITVSLNGIELDSSDYTAGNGTDVVLDPAANTDDIVRITIYGGADVYNKTQANALLGAKAERTQNANTSTVYVDNSNSATYKLYSEDGKIVLEEL